MRDIVFALFALATLIAFFMVVVSSVPHVDLIVVILIGLGLACYDIFSSTRAHRRQDR